MDSEEPGSRVLPQVTLTLLVRRDAMEAISQVCLAMKKRGFGKGYWNGTGGKVKDAESLEQCARREAMEEFGVRLGTLKKVAAIDFHFPPKPEWDQTVHTYLCEDWAGVPTEGEEMAPRWFACSEIPWAQMWPSDREWMRRVLAGEQLEGRITFGEGAGEVKEVELEDPALF